MNTWGAHPWLRRARRTQGAHVPSPGFLLLPSSLRKACFEELSCGWPLSSCHMEVLIKMLPDLPGSLERVMHCALVTGWDVMGWATRTFPQQIRSGWCFPLVLRKPSFVRCYCCVMETWGRVQAFCTLPTHTHTHTHTHIHTHEFSDVSVSHGVKSVGSGSPPSSSALECVEN